MDRIQSDILNRLLDKYERSKSFTGENKVTQSFAVKISRVFPKYMDDAEYEYFCGVNEALRELEAWDLVAVSWKQNGVAEEAALKAEKLDRCYQVLGRLPRRKEQKNLAEKLDRYRGESDTALQRYAEAQLERIRSNKSVEYYTGDLEEFSDLLKLSKALQTNTEEIFIRNFSVELFGDSKRVEHLRGKAEALLYQYGDFEEKAAVFEECGVVATPTYVCMKGNGRIELKGQMIDLSGMEGDIALSTASLRELEGLEVFGKRVVTVENLTSFHDYGEKDDFIVYLGGFHNPVKRKFLQFLYKCNPNKEYRHFGDIDAGGFYIFEHLKRKTQIPFQPLYMDQGILREYLQMTKPLTGNDRKRLEQFLTRYEGEDEKIIETIRFMLEKNCKLEQEIVRNF